MANSVGVKVHALTEAVDLFPTFLAMAGLPALPADQVLQGASFESILANPANTANYKPYAFSQFAKALVWSRELQKKVGWDTCDKCNRTTIDFMGYSVRSDTWRCVAKGVGPNGWGRLP